MRKKYVAVRTWTYQSEYPHKHPGGMGTWIFSVKEHPIPEELNNPAICFWGSRCLYSEARRAALAWAQDKNVGEIYLLP